MKITGTIATIGAWICVGVATPAIFAQVPAGSGFTYQGRVKQSNSLLNQSCDFKFSLWDSPCATELMQCGNQIGQTLVFEGAATIPVSKGLFNAVLDFGANAFNGDARYLQLEVRCPPGIGIYEKVRPRQLLSPAPYAINGGGWTLNSAGETYFTGGNVGIGTSNPSAELFVVGDVVTTDTTSGPNAVGALGPGVLELKGKYQAVTPSINFNRIGDPGDPTFSIFNDGFGLHVESAEAAHNDIFFESIVPRDNQAVVIDATDAQSLLQLSLNGAWRWALGNDVANDNSLYFQPAGAGPAMTISQNGKVGIGTSDPQTPLEVVGDVINGDATTAAIRINNLSTGYLLMDYRTIDSPTSSLFLQKHSGHNMYLALGGGNVGIGTTDVEYKFEVNGSAGKPGGGSWSSSSDARLKRNIDPLDNALGRLLDLRGVTYEWIEPAKHGNLTGPQIGMIAQEVEPFFPNWVAEDSQGFKTLGFMGFEALTVEALRDLRAEKDQQIASLKTEIADQQTEINSQRQEIDELRGELAQLRKLIRSVAAANGVTGVSP